MSKIVDRIRRCLALANSAVGTPEGDLAMDRAVSMAKNAGLDISSISLEIKSCAERFFFEPAANSMWRALLANEICKYVGMEMLRDKNRFHLIGRKEDMETWRAFYIRAEREIDEEAKRYISRHGGGKSDGDSFRKSASNGFGVRLARHKQEAESSVQGKSSAAALGEGESFALVMTGRALEVSTLKNRLYPRVKTSSISSNGSSHARSAGYQFGSNMGVHKGSIR